MNKPAEIATAIPARTSHDEGREFLYAHWPADLRMLDQTGRSDRY